MNGPRFLYSFCPPSRPTAHSLSLGRDVGATPDGRRARHPLSENQSPSEGADLGGLTALLNSAARLPYGKITGGPLNIRIHPSAIAGDEGVDRFTALLGTSSRRAACRCRWT